MSQAGLSWVDWFTATNIGRYFAKIDASYLNDLFNFYGLRGKIPDYKYALERIRGNYTISGTRPDGFPQSIDDSAIRLYGLLHARFLLTRTALDQMRDKYSRNIFPCCPRYSCKSVTCLPYGTSDELDESVLRLYCPKCNEVYVADNPDFEVIDGAFFGPSWIHLFVSSFPEIVRTLRRGRTKPSPRLFGFRIEFDDKNEEDEVEDGQGVSCYMSHR
jgi:casein kinase II subunit beta